jgi:hypothetical protein
VEYPAKAKMLLDQVEKKWLSAAHYQDVMALAADCQPCG